MTRRYAALLNDGNGRFWRYEPGDKLVPGGPILTIDPAETNPLDKVFEIGNRMGADATGTRWPSNVRSLSSGDVILDVTSCPWVGYAIDPVGFKTLSSDEVLAGLYGSPNERGAAYEDVPPTGSALT